MDEFPRTLLTTYAATKIATALMRARQMIRIARKSTSVEHAPVRASRALVLPRHAAAAHRPLGRGEGPAAEGIGDERQRGEHDVLEDRIEQRSRAERLRAQDVDRVR